MVCTIRVRTGTMLGGVARNADARESIRSVCGCSSHSCGNAVIAQESVQPLMSPSSSPDSSVQSSTQRTCGTASVVAIVVAPPAFLCVWASSATFKNNDHSISLSIAQSVYLVKWTLVNVAQKGPIFAAVRTITNWFALQTFELKSKICVCLY